MKQFLAAGPNDTLDAAFSKTKSSHDAVLVYDGDRFLGIVSPIHAVFQKRYSYGTKAKSCLVHPPRATQDTPLSKIASFMRETGIYQAPLFKQDGSILRLLDVHALLEKALEDRQIARGLDASVKPDAVHVAPQDISVRELDRRFRNTGSSGILLVSGAGQLLGIVTRHDVQPLFTKPSQLQRVKSGGGKLGGRVRDFVFGVEKKKRLEAPAREFATKDVLVAPARASCRQVISKMREAQKNSCVLVDGAYRPTGIITAGTLLHALSSMSLHAEAPVFVRNKAQLPLGDVELVRREAEKFSRKMARRTVPDRLEVTVSEAKNPAGRPVEFEVACELYSTAGNDYFASGKDRNLMRAVRDTLERIEKQSRKHPF